MDIYTIGGEDESSPQCQGGTYKNVFGVEFDTYDPAVELAVYNAFNSATADSNFTFGNVVFETYGNQAVQAVADDSTAVPFRNFTVVV